MVALVALVSGYADHALYYLDHLNKFEQLMYLWGFVLGGILLAVQASQIGEATQFEWTKLNKRTIPYWITAYTTIFLLLLTGAHEVWTAKMETWTFLHGREQQLMNGLWLGVIGLDMALVFFATLTFLTRTISPAAAPKPKAQ